LKLNGHVSELTPSTARLWQFGECQFDELSFELRVHGTAVELERKPLELLLQLLSGGGSVIRKEDLLERVWPGVLVVDASLATAVSKLRKALGDQDVIQTVSKVGYRIRVPITNEVLHPQATAPEVAWTPTATATPTPTVFSIDSLSPQAAHRRRRSALPLWAAAVLVAASVVFVATRPKSRPSAVPLTLAILPFQNAASDPSLDYLRAALPDQVANTLNSARSLTIRPLAAAAQFSGPSLNFAEVAHTLDVNRIVAGHYVRAGEQLQVTMEAIDPGENRVIWRETVNVPSTNLLALQEQVAGMARWKLSRALGISEFVSEEALRATNEEAYELYLKSTALEWNMVANQQAIDLLRHSVMLDPNYAPAWGLLSLRYYAASRFGGGGPRMLEFADAASERELALDPDSPNPVAELTIHRTERGGLVEAHRTALELLRRRPDNPNNHHVLSYVLRYGGSLEESAHECDLVMLLAAKFVWGACSTTFMELGDYKKARSLLRANLSSEWSRAHAIDVYLRAGNLEEVLKVPAPQVPGWESYQMVLACARQAPASEVHALAAKVRSDDDPEVDYFFAGQLAFCGQTNAAIRMLKLSIDRNYCSFPAMDKDPLFDRLRDVPEFKKVRATAMLCHESFLANRKRPIEISEQALKSSLK
jgi:DNA-binding winged helix-turn-helix (wHTH) protein/TolB-like protein